MVQLKICNLTRHPCSSPSCLSSQFPWLPGGHARLPSVHLYRRLARLHQDEPVQEQLPCSRIHNTGFHFDHEYRVSDDKLHSSVQLTVSKSTRKGRAVTSEDGDILMKSMRSIKNISVLYVCIVYACFIKFDAIIFSMCPGLHCIHFSHQKPDECITSLMNTMNNSLCQRFMQGHTRRDYY